MDASPQRRNEVAATRRRNRISQIIFALKSRLREPVRSKNFPPHITTNSATLNDEINNILHLVLLADICFYEVRIVRG